MKGNEIIVSGPPINGREDEGKISGTPKPGTLVQIKAATAMVGGRFTYEAYDGTTGLFAVLDKDHYQGRIATTAYVTGDHVRVYYPLPGDDLNLLVADVGGTGDTIAIGDIFAAGSAGKLAAATGTASGPLFTAMEASAALAADTLIWMRYVGYGN